MSGGTHYDLSVVISTHARPRELREAIAAVFRQEDCPPGRSRPTASERFDGSKVVNPFGGQDQSAMNWTD